MKEFFKKLFKKIVGINKLEEEVFLLNRKLNSTISILERHQKMLDSVQEDNRIIINHVKMINRDFSVIADINNSKYDPSVVIVLRNFRGQKEVVKTYNFKDETVRLIYQFLEGFGEDNVTIDSGRRKFPKPRFRY